MPRPCQGFEHVELAELERRPVAARTGRVIGPSLTKATGSPSASAKRTWCSPSSSSPRKPSSLRLLEEGVEILGPVEVAERLDEAAPVEIGQRGGVGRAGVAIG